MRISQLVLVAVPTLSVVANAIEPQGILLGSGVTLYPGVKVEMESSNNVYQQPSGDEISSTITTLNPYAGVAVDLGDATLQAKYDAVLESYSEGGDSILGHNLTANGQIELAPRHNLVLSGKLGFITERMGTGSTSGLGGDDLESYDPSKYTTTLVRAAYDYGSRAAFMNVSLGADYFSKSYSNNEDLTDALNHSKPGVDVGVSFRLGSSLRSVADVRLTNTTYSDEGAKYKNSSSTRGLVGLDWQVTGKTSGVAKVGLESVSTDGDSSSGIPSESSSNAVVEFGLVWTPRNYSQISLSYRTGTTENGSSLTADEDSSAAYIDVTNLVLAWNHSYSVKWSNKLSYSRTTGSFVGGNDNRSDTKNGYGYLLMYSPMKILGIYGSFDLTSKYSNDPGYEYDEQVVGLGVELAI